jgi:flagellar basal-body rod modification protein FlgD
MMATSLGIWNHAVPANSLASANPAATGPSGTSASEGAAISANDFLTLLVTEMKNQDPTANNDPNAYVNQLVQVNSLEQLININQTLTTGLGVSGSSPSGGSQPNPGIGAATASASAAHAGNYPAAVGVPVHLPHAISNSNSAISTEAGNLSVPPANPAAQRIANALGHHRHVD